MSITPEEYVERILKATENPKPPISLRDYFAGQALAGMCAADRRWDNGKWDMAVASYSLADAMLAARKEPEE